MKRIYLLFRHYMLICMIGLLSAQMMCAQEGSGKKALQEVVQSINNNDFTTASKLLPSVTNWAFTSSDSTTFVELETAISYYRHLVSEDPPHPLADSVLLYIAREADYLTDVYYTKEQYQKALVFSELRVFIYQRLFSPIDPFNYVTLFNHAIVCERAEDYLQAAHYYIQAVHMFEDSDLLEFIAHNDNSKAHLYNTEIDIHKKNVIQAINNGNYKQACYEIVHVQDWSLSLLNEMIVDIDSVAAFSQYASTIGIASSFIDSLHIYTARMLDEFFSTFHDQGESDLAGFCAQYVLDTYQSILGKEHPAYAKALYNIGLLAIDKYDYSSAEILFQRAQEIQKETLSPYDTEYLTTLNSLGDLYLETGDYAKSEQYFSQVEALSQPEEVVSLVPVYAHAKHGMGKLYVKTGDYHKAAMNLSSALVTLWHARWTQNPNVELLGTIVTELADLYLVVKDYAKAEYYHQRAHQLFGLLGEEHHGCIMADYNLGKVYHSIKEYNTAAQYYQKAINTLMGQKKILDPIYAKSFEGLGQIDVVYGFYESAEQAQLLANKIWKDMLGDKHPDYAASLLKTGMLYHTMHNYSEAEAYIKASASIQKDMFAHAIDFMTDKQREMYWHTMQYTFEIDYPQMIYSIYPTNEHISKFAYDNELFHKGLLLNSTNTISQSILDSKNDYLISQWNELTALRRQILVLEEKDPQSKTLPQLRTDAETLEKYVTRSSATYRESQHQWNITWDSVRSHLAPDQVAIEYFQAPLSQDSTAYCALLLRDTCSYPILVPLFEQKQVQALISHRPDEIYNYYDNGEQLTQIIWGKILPLIQPGEEIIFAPSGLLHQLAIEALPYDEERTMGDVFRMRRFSSTREIALQHTTSPHTTATLYGGIQYDTDPTDMAANSATYDAAHLLASRSFGDAAIDRGKVGYLPGTKLETEAINRLLSENRMTVQLFSADTANEESFKALSGKHRNILHIATHGFYWPDSTAQKQQLFQQHTTDGDIAGPKTIDPLNRCGLLFAGANTALQGHSADLPEGVQDGILTAKEISLLDFRDADLVVLSACETGKGEITGDGVFGLQRAFKMAGARTIIMSLWPVNDAATQMLMTEFYRNWITNGQPKLEAFRQAQAAVRQHYEEPVYWAGFIMLD